LRELRSDSLKLNAPEVYWNLVATFFGIRVEEITPSPGGSGSGSSNAASSSTSELFDMADVCLNYVTLCKNELLHKLNQAAQLDGGGNVVSGESNSAFVSPLDYPPDQTTNTQMVTFNIQIPRSPNSLSISEQRMKMPLAQRASYGLVPAQTGTGRRGTTVHFQTHKQAAKATRKIPFKEISLLKDDSRSPSPRIGRAWGNPDEKSAIANFETDPEGRYKTIPKYGRCEYIQLNREANNFHPPMADPPKVSLSVDLANAPPVKAPAITNNNRVAARVVQDGRPISPRTKSNTATTVSNSLPSRPEHESYRLRALQVRAAKVCTVNTGGVQTAAAEARLERELAFLNREMKQKQDVLKLAGVSVKSGIHQTTGNIVFAPGGDIPASSRPFADSGTNNNMEQEEAFVAEQGQEMGQATGDRGTRVTIEEDELP